MKNINKRKGISLIVLVITILVMIILAGVVVVSLQKNNPIEKAKDSKDMTNLASMREELELYKTNELMLGNNPNNIFANLNESDKILKSIPSNLKGKVVIANGKLGVYYSSITKNAQDYARENDIFDAEDKIAPDVDVYIEERAGKKYVVCDGVDYETDISKILSNTGMEKIVDTSFEKIGFRKSEELLEKDVLFENLKRDFNNIEEIKDMNNLSKYNVLIIYGGWYASDKNIDNEEKYIEFFNSSTKNNKKIVVTSGNNSSNLTGKHPLIAEHYYNNSRTSVVLNKVASSDTITRSIDEWNGKTGLFHEDYQYQIKLKESPYIKNYYEDVNAPVGYKNNIGMYLDKENGRGWFHMQTGPIGTENYYKKYFSNTYKSSIYKMTGSRSMEIDVTGVAPGTKYSFTVTDLAGNKVIKEITL